MLSPIIVSSSLIKKGRIWIRIVRELGTEEKPQKSFTAKLIKGERKAPDHVNAYRGFVRITTVDSNTSRAKKNIDLYLNKDFLGRRVNEGFGKVKWLNYKIENYVRNATEKKQKKFRIRKGLGPNYPKELQRLLRALMLHDFVETEKHPSKIFKEISIKDEEIREACLKHHNVGYCKNILLPLVRYYDHLAAYMNRKSVHIRNCRYDYENGKIDFEKLANDIEERQQSAYKLYNFIYYSKELSRTVEAMKFGKTSLRDHLLLMANLAIHGYCNRWLIMENGKIELEKKISSSVTRKDELECAKDVEMHLLSSMSNA